MRGYDVDVLLAAAPGKPLGVFGDAIPGKGLSRPLRILTFKDDRGSVNVFEVHYTPVELAYRGAMYVVSRREALTNAVVGAVGVHVAYAPALIDGEFRTEEYRIRPGTELTQFVLESDRRARGAYWMGPGYPLPYIRVTGDPQHPAELVFDSVRGEFRLALGSVPWAARGWGLAPVFAAGQPSGDRPLFQVNRS